MVEPAITVDTSDYERWMREQRFPTRTETIAYRSGAETWAEAWLQVCWLILGAEYTRPIALEAAGISVDSFARTRRKRGGLAAREAAALEREIASEIASIETLRRDRQACAGCSRLWRGLVSPGELREPPSMQISPLGGWWADVQRWHAAKKHPKARALWTRLIALREERIVACHAAIVAFHRRAEHLATANESGSPGP